MEQATPRIAPFVPSGVFGGKSPNGVNKEQRAFPLTPFVLSLSKGECGELEVPRERLPSFSRQMHAFVHQSTRNNPRPEQQKSTIRSPLSPFDRLRTNGAKGSAPYSISTCVAIFLSAATCTLATAAPGIAQAQAAIPDHPAGRLFFTQAERDLLDRGISVVGNAAKPLAGGDTPRFDGMLSTKGHKPVLWVNGRMLGPDENKVGEFTIEQLAGQTLTIRDKKRSVALKPGQRFDAAKGAVRETGGGAP